MLSHLVDGNNGRCLPDGRKRMQSPGNIEDVVAATATSMHTCAAIAAMRSSY